MGLTFTNIHGAPVAVAPVKPKTSPRLAPDAFHKGYLVVGYSPIQLAQARLHWEKTSDKPFDEAGFMRKARPLKVRTEPFAIHESAQQLAEMARKLGWKVVQVNPVTKGRA